MQIKAYPANTTGLAKNDSTFYTLTFICFSSEKKLIQTINSVAICLIVAASLGQNLQDCNSLTRAKFAGL